MNASAATSLKTKKNVLRIVRDHSSHQETSKSYREMSDEQLIVASQQGRSGAIESLLARHRKTIASMLYRLAPDWYDTEDIMQEVYIRIWRSLAQLRNPASFKTWLNQIVTNLFYDELRKKRKELQVSSLDEPTSTENGSEGPSREVMDTSPQPEEKLLSKELTGIVETAMCKIPKQFRTVVYLRDIKGCPYEEIANITSTELGTVKSRIARARSKIQAQLTSYIGECA